MRWTIGRRLHARRARGSAKRVGLALVYHRIDALPGDERYELVPALALGLFQAQLDHLRTTYDVVSPSRLLDATLDRRAGESFPVTITFDDDLHSPVDVAAPALIRAGLPAAFFLCGAVAGATSSFWWEDLQELVDHPDGEPLQLESLPELDLASAARSTPYAIHEAAGMIERLPPERRDAVAAELRARVRPRPRALTVTDIATLASAGFEIGFHTRRHYLLTTLDDAILRAALTEGRQEIDAAARQRLRMLAYPHGKADQRVAEAARSAGYDYGFTASDACVFPDTDALLLGRVEAQAVPIGYFARSLAALLAAG